MTHLASLIGDYVLTSSQAAIEQTTGLLSELDVLRDRIDIGAANKEDFSELFKSCHLVVVRSNREEKLQAAAAILANILFALVSRPRSSYEELDHLIRLLIRSRLHRGNICPWSYPARPGNRCEVRELGFQFDQLRSEFSNFDASFVMSLVVKLTALNLLRTQEGAIKLPDYVLRLACNGTYLPRTGKRVFRALYVHVRPHRQLAKPTTPRAKLGIVGLSKSIALDMQRFNVRSNCVSPFAWSRLIGTIPTETEAEKQRVARMQRMGPEKIAPLAAFLLGDAAKDVTGQIFAVRMNEIFLMGQSRPLRSVHRGEGWSPSTLAMHGMPALRPSFYELDRSADVFNWDPI